MMAIAEKQAIFLLTTRPILATLTALAVTGGEGEDDEVPDPNQIKGGLTRPLGEWQCSPEVLAPTSFCRILNKSWQTHPQGGDSC